MHHTIVGLAVALKQVRAPEYKAYQEQVLSNYSKFAQRLLEKGYELVSGGIENHLVLVNLRNKGIDCSRMDKVLESVHIVPIKMLFQGTCLLWFLVASAWEPQLSYLRIFAKEDF